MGADSRRAGAAAGGPGNQSHRDSERWRGRWQTAGKGGGAERAAARGTGSISEGRQRTLTAAARPGGGGAGGGAGSRLRRHFETGGERSEPENHNRDYTQLCSAFRF